MSDDLVVEPIHHCPDCDKSFGSPAALAGHRMVHTPAGPCPECGRDNFKQANALARHRAVSHGVTPAYKLKQGGPRGRPRQNSPVDAGPWNVDDVFESVVLTLWPDKLVPVQALVPLMEWREATRVMMEKVQA